MNDLAELKQYVVAHAESQRMPPEHYGPLLELITSDDDGGPGSWVAEWSAVAEDLAAAGEHLAAGQHWTMARFPFVDGVARGWALERAVASFDAFRAGVPHIQRLEVPFAGGVVKAWTSGLSPSDPKPLMIMTGGIVSTKEQWGPVLLQVAELGFAGIVTELPGVGENTVRYDRDSYGFFSAVIDAVKDRAQVDRTYLLALSFSGHSALRAALHDPRIRGVVTAGAPIRHFFTDAEWHPKVPRLTVDTTAHLAGLAPSELFDHLGDWALSEAELAALDVPVAYVASARDEIIPGSDLEVLRREVAQLDVLEHDDVHGSPAHFVHTRLWTTLSLLRIAGHEGPVRDALEAQVAAFSG